MQLALRSTHAAATTRRHQQPAASLSKPITPSVLRQAPAGQRITLGSRRAVSGRIITAAAADGSISAGGGGGEDNEMMSIPVDEPQPQVFFSEEKMAQQAPELPDPAEAAASSGRATETDSGGGSPWPQSGQQPASELAGEGAPTEAEAMADQQQADQQQQPQQSASASAAAEGPTGSAEGGRFDEEPAMPEHPYDPRPRERGHGVPPHRDASNTRAPGSGSGQEGAEPVGQSEPAASAADSIVGRHPEGDEQNPAAAI